MSPSNGNTGDGDYVRLSPARYHENPGYLKLDLMIQGVRIAAEVTVSPARGTDYAGASDLDLVLPNGLWVSVRTDPATTAPSIYSLEGIGSGGEVTHVVRSPYAEVPVKVVPVPAFYEKKTSCDTRLGDIGVLKGGYLALAPDTTCDFINSSEQCKFCSAVLKNGGHAPAKTVEDVVETVRAARAEASLELVYLSIGYRPTEDAGIALLEPYVRAIKHHFDILVAVDVIPPATDAWVDRTYAMGVDSISYNLEVYDPFIFNQTCPGMAQRVGRQRYLDALSYASTVFPGGAVSSHLIVGLEPLGSLREGIDLLAAKGIVPILPLARPFKGLEMEDALATLPTAEELAPVYAHLYRRIKEHKISLSWVRNMSVVTTPLDGRYFAGEEAPLRTLMANFYRTRFGRGVGARLSDLRRSLRVRESKESSDPSGS